MNPLESETDWEVSGNPGCQELKSRRRSNQLFETACGGSEISSATIPRRPLLIAELKGFLGRMSGVYLSSFPWRCRFSGIPQAAKAWKLEAATDICCSPWHDSFPTFDGQPSSTLA